MFHLRDGFYFDRDGDEIVLRHDTNAVHSRVETRVPVNEWASAVAFTSLRGDTGDAWREAVEYLNALPADQPERT